MIVVVKKENLNRIIAWHVNDERKKIILDNLMSKFSYKGNLVIKCKKWNLLKLWKSEDIYFSEFDTMDTERYSEQVNKKNL